MFDGKNHLAAAVDETLHDAQADVDNFPHNQPLIPKSNINHVQSNSKIAIEYVAVASSRSTGAKWVSR